MGPEISWSHAASAGDVNGISYHPHFLSFPAIFFFHLLSRLSIRASVSNLPAKEKAISSDIFPHFSGWQNCMNSRELVLLATATVFGAVASALAVRFFSFNQKRHFPRTDSSGNSAVSNNGYSQSQSPFDPSKRKGLVRYLKLQRRREISLFKFSTILYASFVFIYLFTVRLYFRYLSWDDYFMAIAFLSAERSKDPNRQVIIWFLLLYFLIIIQIYSRLSRNFNFIKKFKSIMLPSCDYCLFMSQFFIFASDLPFNPVLPLQVGACLVSQNGVILGKLICIKSASNY